MTLSKYAPSLKKDWGKVKLILLLIFFLTSCTMPQEISPTPASLPPNKTATFLSTDTPAPTATFTPTPTLTPTATSTLTFTPTIIPTYAILRGEVLERANCRYGPGAPYLYKYGLIAGSNLEIIGRLDDANWIQIQAIGGDNPCWVKASLMDIKGDIFTLAPIYPDFAPLPVSPYYVPLTLLEVTRAGNQVTIRWYGQTLIAGDDEYEGAPIYLAEIWACENGEIKFTPYGLREEKLTITDENGCNERSYARIYFSEKHGYAGPTEIEFPE